MKIIIDNQSDLNGIMCLRLLNSIFATGKVSNNGKQHAYATTFKLIDKEYAVYSVLNKASERFIIINYPDQPA